MGWDPNTFAPIVWFDHCPSSTHRFVCGMAPIDYNPVVLRKPFIPHAERPALQSAAASASEALPPLLDIDPGPRVEWDFNPPETCAARHTIRDDPPPCFASVLSHLWDRHLRFSLNIGTTGSHVPHKSLDQVHAISMPDAAQTINRLPLGLSCRPPSTRSFDLISDISTPHQWFAGAHLLDPYLTQSWLCLFLNAHHKGSLPMQLKVV